MNNQKFRRKNLNNQKFGEKNKINLREKYEGVE